MPGLRGAILIGSLAAATADEMSDVDLLVVAEDGAFAGVWPERCRLHADNTLACWDVRDDATPEAGAHTWLTAEMVLVECLIADRASGVRLAEPHEVVVGAPDLAAGLPHRPPVDRGEMTAGGHPIEDAYDTLKHAVRRTRRSDGR